MGSTLGWTAAEASLDSPTPQPRSSEAEDWLLKWMDVVTGPWDGSSATCSIDLEECLGDVEEGDVPPSTPGSHT
jgi:hypothetical protein